MEKKEMYLTRNTVAEKNDVWSEVPSDLAERVAALLSRILSDQFDAKITCVAVKRSGSVDEKGCVNDRTAYDRGECEIA